jgi:hypothetical protein
MKTCGSWNLQIHMIWQNSLKFLNTAQNLVVSVRLVGLMGQSCCRIWNMKAQTRIIAECKILSYWRGAQNTDNLPQLYWNQSEGVNRSVGRIIGSHGRSVQGAWVWIFVRSIVGRIIGSHGRSIQGAWVWILVKSIVYRLFLLWFLNFLIQTQEENNEYKFP